MGCFPGQRSTLEKAITSVSTWLTMHNTTCPFTGEKNLKQLTQLVQWHLGLNTACIFLNFYRHGLKQYRNGWADGPAYITQCPVQIGQSYTYDINVTEQRGTLWWHAHIFWLRATVYGAIVIMPKQGIPYPFPQPNFEFNLLLGSIHVTRTQVLASMWLIWKNAKKITFFFWWA